MATLILTAAATAIGGSFGFSAFAMAALKVGAGLIGRAIDNALFSQTTEIQQEGPRLDEVRFAGSSEGSPINRITGRVRIPGNIIWTTKYREEIVTTTTSSGGGKGGGGGGSSVTTTEYLYYVSFALAVCEGPVQQFGRIWADGAVVDQAKYEIRPYLGTLTQNKDPKIVAVEGDEVVSAYRGTAYLVFEEINLTEGFANRIPQLHVEVYKSPAAGRAEFEDKIRALTIIPSSGEFAYGTTEVIAYSSSTNFGGDDTSDKQNNHSNTEDTDFVASIDQLERLAPNMDKPSLVVAWHGTDLRVGSCELQPRVEIAAKETTPYSWQVSGLNRSQATVVSYDDEDRPYVGGTTSDVAVKEAIQDLNARGMDVCFYPFILMDIPPGNGLPDPYGASEQGAFPWRGRITLGDSADDKTAAAATQVANFFGSAAPGDFSESADITNTYDQCNASGNEGTTLIYWQGTNRPGNSIGDTVVITLADTVTQHAVTIQSIGGSGESGQTYWQVTGNLNWTSQTVTVTQTTDDFSTIYTGPAEWSFRRMILHYAKLCAAAGGVDTFIIGTEMRELNRIRDNTGAHPAVQQFKSLAADVRTILGSGTTITYAADWSEFPNYRPDDGSNDVIFHLDPLWSDSNIDVIGIDNYQPLSDWRDTEDHLDAQNYDSIYDLDYLKSNIAGGEGFDWFYADATDRFNQTRTPIEDTAHGEDWIFAYKDLVNWWQNSHRNRPGGIRDAGSTAWVPESKPIWFTEVGCPAVDKGTNQPNVFIDPKSSESYAPYFSSSGRDDFIARQYNIALLEYWNDNSNNPASGVYSGRMVDPDRMYIWTWDARPFPEFPYRGAIWSDGDNWETGHWLNGRIGQSPLRYYVEELVEPFGVSINADELYGMITGYVVNDTLSVRAILQPLMRAYFFDAFESEGIIKFKHRGSSPILSLLEEDLVADDKPSKLGGPFQLTRGQLTETPKEVRAKFTLDDYDYSTTALSARRLIGSGSGVSESSYALTMNATQGQSMVDSMLIESHVTRERIEMKLPPSLLRLDATDIVSLNINNRDFDFRLEELGYEYFRPATGFRTEASTYKRSPGPSLRRIAVSPNVVGLSTTSFMDLPMLRDTDIPYAPWFASSAVPWPGPIAIYRSPTGSNFTQDTGPTVPSVLGSTTADLPAGPIGLWDRANSLEVAVNTYGTLQSLDELDVLAGGNTAALYNPLVDEWEIIQWATATAGASTNTFILTDLLRGQLGSDHAMGNPLPAGSRFVILDTPLVQSNMPSTLRGTPLEWQYGPAKDAIGSNTYQTINFTPRGVGLRPLSPAHLSATKDAASNDITLSWLRRTRIGGETWDNSDVPLSEDFERYEIDILDALGTTVLRTIVVNDTTTYVYTAGTQTADFGSSPTTLNFEVFQISGTYGRGIGRSATQTFNF